MKYKKAIYTGIAILCVGTIALCQPIPCIAQSNSVTVEAIYQQHKDSIIFTTTPYQAEALELVLQEANRAARQLNLPENLPITVTNLTDVFINPFEYAYEEKSLGSVASSNYYYYVSQGDKFNCVVEKDLESDLRNFQRHFFWPTNRIDLIGAYQLATQFLAAVSIDVNALNHDHAVVVKPDVVFFGHQDNGFVPVYDVFWPRGQDAGGSVASVQVFPPNKKLLQLCVQDPKYILRPPVVFTNLVELLLGTNLATQSIQPAPCKPSERNGSSNQVIELYP